MASISLPRQRPPTKQHTPTARSLTRKASIVSVQSDMDRPYIDPDEDYPLFTAPYSASQPKRYVSSPPRQSSNHDARYTSPPSRWHGVMEDPPKGRKHQSKPSVKSVSSLREDNDRKGKGKESTAYANYDDFANPSFGHGQGSSKSRSRARPFTSPSPSDWGEIRPSFRDSGSSSLSQFETPPHTPTDELLSLQMERISVFAPMSGVEQMDAMVDGLNSFGGGDRDSFFGGRTLPSSRISKVDRGGFHPLYQPPLPTPPPGVKLGGGRARKVSRQSRQESDEDDESLTPSPYTPEKRKVKKAPSFTRAASANAISRRPLPQPPADVQFPTVNPSIEEIIKKYAPETRKKSVPSISEIIRAHAPRHTSLRSSQSRHVSLDDEEMGAEMEPLTAEEEAQLMSRSSMDSVTEEVQNSIRQHSNSPTTAARPAQRARSFAHRQSIYSESIADASIRSPRSDGASLYSYSVISEPAQPAPDFLISPVNKAPSASQAIARYLRSSRLTTLLKLTNGPHASHENPLTVSLSDLGSPTGFPLVVFLGLGCVRHVMGLYDEMAECLGLRLITIDRWGLGRTQTPRKSARGIPEWSAVVAEVLDRLGIDKCSVMAHSAGAPYALSFANQNPERIRGEICLLAPWIGEGAGYKWLKYVPNGIIKTAQAAEWKVQAWMLGKPPTINYEGIGYSVQAPLSSSTAGRGSYPPYKPGRTASIRGNTEPMTEPMSPIEPRPRPSIGDSIFSEYDDLRDFDGRFESQSTVGPRSTESSRPRYLSEMKPANETSRKSTKGFLGKLRGSSNSQPPSPQFDKPAGPTRRLKALRSMSSLKSKASSAPSTLTRVPSLSITPKLQLPKALSIEVGLGFGEIKWNPSPVPSPLKDSQPFDYSETTPSPYSRAAENQTVSISAHKSSPMSSLPPSPLLPSSVPPSPSSPSSSSTATSKGGSYQAMLGNALIAASHAESAKGTHTDLVQILNHDRLPWGFSYSDYPHDVRVWYGDKDERIAESAVRWLERTMGPTRCHVNVVKGADHGLMYKSAVVIDVFEQVYDYSRYD